MSGIHLEDVNELDNDRRLVDDETPLNKEDVKIELIDSLVKRMNCM